jgi:hypothetical protein
VRQQVLQHEMFPQHAQIVLPQGIPAPREADHTRVEAVHLRLLGQLVLAAAVEGPDHRSRVSGLERAQMALHGGARDTQCPARRGHFELPAALAEHVLEERVETVDVAEAEQPLNIAGEERVQPLAEKRRGLGFGQQGLRQAAVMEPPRQRHPERRQFLPEHGQQVNRALSSRQRVTELVSRGEGGRSGGEDLQPGKGVRPDLQEPRRVAQLVDLVEDHDKCTSCRRRRYRQTASNSRR